MLTEQDFVEIYIVNEKLIEENRIYNEMEGTGV